MKTLFSIKDRPPKFKTPTVEEIGGKMTTNSSFFESVYNCNLAGTYKN